MPRADCELSGKCFTKELPSVGERRKAGEEGKEARPGYKPRQRPGLGPTPQGDSGADVTPQVVRTETPPSLSIWAKHLQFWATL